MTFRGIRRKMNIIDNGRVNVSCVGGEKNSNVEWDPKLMRMFWGYNMCTLQKSSLLITKCM